MKILEPGRERFLSSPVLIIITCGRLEEMGTTRKSKRLLRVCLLRIMLLKGVKNGMPESKR